MIGQISNHIKNSINEFSMQDSLILNGSTYPIQEENFQSITANQEAKTVSFIDGGQAQIISCGTFCLTFIRVSAVTFKGNQKIQNTIKEFFLFTKAHYKQDEIYYTSTIFGDAIIDAVDLYISSNDTTIKVGKERAPISKVANMARRFAEIKLASLMQSDFVLLDGTLEPTFKHEEKYLATIPHASALAKSSTLFTTNGNSPVVILNNLASKEVWQYTVNQRTRFVKLHEKSKHVFRFEGNNEILPYLVVNASGALFLGYPYGLILADKLARVTNQEQKSLKTKFLLNKENQAISQYLSSTNAHDILDTLG